MRRRITLAGRTGADFRLATPNLAVRPRRFRRRLRHQWRHRHRHRRDHRPRRRRHHRRLRRRARQRHRRSRLRGGRRLRPGRLRRPRRPWLPGRLRHRTNPRLPGPVKPRRRRRGRGRCALHTGSRPRHHQRRTHGSTDQNNSGDSEAGHPAIVPARTGHPSGKPHTWIFAAWLRSTARPGHTAHRRTPLERASVTSTPGTTERGACPVQARLLRPYRCGLGLTTCPPPG